MSNYQPQHRPEPYPFPGAPPNPGVRPPARRQWIGWVVAVVILAAVTAVVLLAGHSGGGRGRTSSLSRTPNAGQQETLARHDLVFLSVAHSIPSLAAATDEQLVNVGHATCAALDAGNSLLAVVQITETSGQMDVYEAGQFVGASITAYCPEQAYLTQD